MRYLIATVLEGQLVPQQRLLIPFQWKKAQHSLLVIRMVIRMAGRTAGRMEPAQALPDEARWEIYAWLNLCPHWSIPLEPPPWDGQPCPVSMDSFGQEPPTPTLSCSTHGARFHLKTGECVWGPCLGEALTAVPYCHALGRIFFFLPPFMRNL